MINLLLMREAYCYYHHKGVVVYYCIFLLLLVRESCLKLCHNQTSMMYIYLYFVHMMHLWYPQETDAEYNGGFQAMRLGTRGREKQER